MAMATTTTSSGSFEVAGFARLLEPRGMCKYAIRIQGARGTIAVENLEPKEKWACEIDFSEALSDELTRTQLDVQLSYLEMAMASNQPNEWITVAREGADLTLRMTVKGHANQKSAWDLSSLTLTPVELEDCKALRAELMVAHATNGQVTERLKVSTTLTAELLAMNQFQLNQLKDLRAQNQLYDHEIRGLKAKVERLENPPGSEDLTAIQSQMGSHALAIEQLLAKVDTSNMKLLLVPQPESNERTKRQRAEFESDKV